MVAEGQILKFTIQTTSTLLPDLILNTYFYDVVEVPPSMTLAGSGQEILDEFIAQLGTAWAPIIHEQYYLARGQIDIVENPLDFFSGDATTPVAGAGTSQVMPNFVAWGFRLNRSTRLTRNGSKRYAGVPEDAVEDGNPVTGVIALLNNMATFLESTLTLDAVGPGGEDMVMSPVIIREGLSPTAPIVNPVSSAVFTRITTQNSRKLGRGA